MKSFLLRSHVVVGLLSFVLATATGVADPASRRAVPAGQDEPGIRVVIFIYPYGSPVEHMWGTYYPCSGKFEPTALLAGNLADVSFSITATGDYSGSISLTLDYDNPDNRIHHQLNASFDSTPGKSGPGEPTGTWTTKTSPKAEWWGEDSDLTPTETKSAITVGVSGPVVCKSAPGGDIRPAPDSDGDGVPDHRDKCPRTPKSVMKNGEERLVFVDVTNGCPLDTDYDGVPDHLDECRDTPYSVVDGVPRSMVPVDSDGCAARPAGNELVRNGGFETGDVSDWRTDAGSGQVVTESGVGTKPCTRPSPSSPRTGSFLFSSSSSDGTPPGVPEVVLVQDIDVSTYVAIAEGKVKVKASGFVAGAPGCGAASNDTAHLELEFRNGNGALLGKVSTAPMDPEVGVWNRMILDDVTVPRGTDTISFRYVTRLDPGFSSIDIVADDLSLTLREAP